jgi:hypothetical protein
MKIILGLTTIFVGIILFSSCRKKTIDFRDKYCGSWNNTVEVIKFNFDSIGQHERDTISFIGVINRASADEKINIQYLPDSSITLTVDESGILTGFPNSHCNGKFIEEIKIHLYLRWGGMGGSMECTLSGTKR